MHAPNSQESESKTQDVSSLHADPYLPPSEIPGEAKRGSLRRVLGFLAIVGSVTVVLAIVAIAGLRNHVAKFSFDRGGPPVKIEEYKSLDAEE